jgi:hypothetical protein
MSTSIRRQSKESGIRTPDRPRVPTLAEMIRDGQASQAKIRRSTQEALVEWFAQSQRLNVARTHYHLRGDRFRDFARRLGIDRSSAFQLVKLHRHRTAIMSRCLDEQEQATALGVAYSYPGWESALGWFEQRGHRHPPMVIWQHGSDEWETPAALFKLPGQHLPLRRGCVCIAPERQMPAVLRQRSGRVDPDMASGTHPLDERALQQSWQMGEEGCIGRKGRCHRRRSIRKSVIYCLVSGSCRVVSYGGAARLRFVHQGRAITSGGMSEAPFPSILAIWPREAGARLMSHCTTISAALLRVPE